ncbi:hypothetical protein MMC20_006872 [Loxospora ochrophaea]|nr:hypothetical protein [Loxospora ochrophaea]
MVLEQASATSNDDTSPYDVPASDQDLYDQSNGRLSQSMTIELSKLPRANPIIHAIGGFRNERITQIISLELQQNMNLVRRPLSQQEIDATAYWRAKELAVISWGLPIVLTATLTRAYQTRESYKFPLIKPRPDFDPNVLKAGSYELLKGPPAKYFWHGLRGVSYFIAMAFLIQPFVQSYGMTTMTVGQIADPRLKEINRRKQEVANGRLNQERGEQPRTSTTSGYPQGANRRATGQQGDDMSPTGGSGLFSDYTQGDNGQPASNDTGLLSDNQMQQKEARQQANPQSSPTPDRATTFQVDKVERQPDSFDSTFDDASPTAGNGADGGGGSAWDRIRREAASNPSPRPRGMRRERGPVQQEQQAGSTTGDSFSFSKSDEERSLAKEEAQKAFDERVERERRGGDFNEQGRRW